MLFEVFDLLFHPVSNSNQIVVLHLQTAVFAFVLHHTFGVGEFLLAGAMQDVHGLEHALVGVVLGLQGLVGIAKALRPRGWAMLANLNTIVDEQVLQ